jgi:hypothetical protein
MAMSETGRLATSVKLDGTPVPLGLALADRRALISMEDGRLVCVGEAK